MAVIICLIIAYLLGSIPFGYLVAKIWNIDIRRFGSGNIGAANVFRTLGAGAGVMVFTLDLLKGTLAVILVMTVTQNHWLIILAGALAVLGHACPVFLNFKGGRGAATGLGALLAIAPDIFFFAAIVAALVIYITRYVSVGSMVTAVFVAFIFILLRRPLPYGLIASVVTLVIVLRHWPNIKRLRAGTEPKVGND